MIRIFEQKFKNYSKTTLPVLLVLAMIISMVLGSLVNANTQGDITIDTLLNDPLFEVNNVKWDAVTPYRIPQNPEWNKLVSSDSPLLVGESYTESFDKSYFETRLRPNTATYYTPDVTPDAGFTIVDDAGSKSVLMQTNGVSGGVFDYIEFSGMKFIEGASYTLDVDYTIVTPNRLFKMGFGPNAQVPYFMDLSGTQAGQKVRTSGQFTANTPVGIGADVHAALILMVAGGDDPASIQIDSMTIKRLSSIPEARNAKITGNLQVGQTLTLGYTYYQDAGVLEGGTDIVWVTASDKNGKNLSVISSSAGIDTLKITSDMAGLYVGCIVTPKTVTPQNNGIGLPTVVMASNAVGTAVSYGDFPIDTIGKSILEDFESISSAGNISFTPDDSVISYITDDPSKTISGSKSLFIDSPGGIKGGIFKDITFAGGKDYIVSFKYKFIDIAPSNLFVQFRAPSQGYTADTNQTISAPVVGEVKEFISKRFTFGNFNDYFMQIFDAYGAYKVVIDELKIECVEKEVIIPGDPETTADGSVLTDLATINKPYTTNFANNATDLNLFSYNASHFSVIQGLDALYGKSLKLDYTSAGNGGSIYMFGTKGNLAAAGKYRISFDYKLLTDTKPTGLHTGFTRDAGANQVNSKLTFDGNVKNTIYNYQKEFTIANFNDFYMYMFNLDGSDGSIIVIDNLKIERLEIPPVLTPETISDASTLDDLANIGAPFTENFTKNALGNLFSYDPMHFSIISDANAIAGNSVKQDFTNSTSGAIYALSTSGKLIAGEKYRLTISYKFISDNAPTAFYFGFKSDVGTDQINIPVDFTGKVKNTVYTFTTDYTLGNYSDYYLQWFNLFSADKSIIILDTLILERLATIPIYTPETPSDGSVISDLITINKPYTQNFANNGIELNMYSYDFNHFSIVEGEQAIAGKSLKQDYTNAGFGGIFAFDTSGRLQQNSSYRITANYKVLSDTMPTGMYFGFKSDVGVDQKNVQIDFSGKTKNTIYTFTAEYTLGNFSDYYLQWFNLDGKDGSIIVIDTIKIEQISYELSDISIVGKPFIEDFSKNLIAPNVIGTVVENTNSIFGKSLYISTTSPSQIYFFDFNNKLAPNARYAFRYKFRVVNAPSNGAYGLPAFYLGLTLNGGGTDFVQLDMLNKTDGNVYQSPVIEFVTGDVTTYFPQFYIAQSTPLEIIIDDFMVTRIS